ncbi:hypothetical protein TetV_583 [Tetraselmis virus 1]|uniref:Uncharacterized protein n=1 Tax=Tetraselmis virus 1 TaxID=2060617 RepID=A0A2P0VP37_9VIRU|nr:hypothetical protein QJ968_gp471 [Tetraselmis virus 1]AUF82665.1 hypothetical protein TetV_583 [Tetraselmis virus 1]
MVRLFSCLFPKVSEELDHYNQTIYYDIPKRNRIINDDIDRRIDELHIILNGLINDERESFDEMKACLEYLSLSIVDVQRNVAELKLEVKTMLESGVFDN